MGVVISDGAWVKMEGKGTLVVDSVFLLISIIFRFPLIFRVESPLLS